MTRLGSLASLRSGVTASGCDIATHTRASRFKSDSKRGVFKPRGLLFLYINQPRLTNVVSGPVQVGIDPYERKKAR